MKKRFLICLFILCLLASLAACGGTGSGETAESAPASSGQGAKADAAAPQTQAAESAVTEDDFLTIDLGDGTCKISLCESTASKLVVPGTIRGQKVAGIGDYAFNQCPAEEIVLPDSVEFIEANAFCLCENLRRIDLGTGLKRIGQNAFLSCNQLERVDFPEGMAVLESFCFGACEKLGEVYIPASVQEIPMGITNLSQCPNVVIVTPAGSVAEQTAKDTGLPVRNP